MRVKFCSSFLKPSRPSSSQLPFLPPLGEQTISRLDGRYKLSSVCLRGSFRCTSPGRREGAILTKCPNLLRRLLLTGSGSQSASRICVFLHLSPAPTEETHFSRLCWSSNSFGYYTCQLGSCAVLLHSPFTGISVGCQWDAELEPMQLMFRHDVTSKIHHVSNFCWLKLWGPSCRCCLWRSANVQQILA